MIDLKSDRNGSRGHLFLAYVHSSIRVSTSGQKFTKHAHGISSFNRIVDIFFRNAYALLAECLENIGLLHGLQSGELYIAYDWKLFNLECDDDAAAWPIFYGHA